MLAPQRLPYHTWCTEMLLVKDAVLKQLVNRLLRLATAAAFGHVARIAGHGHEVKVCSEAVKHREGDVE